MKYFQLLTLSLLVSCQVDSNLGKRVWDMDSDAYFFGIENSSNGPVEITVGALFTTSERIDYPNGTEVSVLVPPSGQKSLIAPTQLQDQKYSEYNRPSKRVTVNSFKVQITGLSNGTVVAAGWPREVSDDLTPQYFGLLYSPHPDSTDPDQGPDSETDFSWLKSSLLPPGKEFTSHNPRILIKIAPDGQVSFALDQATLDSLVDAPVK